MRIVRLRKQSQFAGGRGLHCVLLRWATKRGRRRRTAMCDWVLPEGSRESIMKRRWVWRRMGRADSPDFPWELDFCKMEIRLA